MTDAERYMALFEGNQRSRGVFDPGGNQWTDKVAWGLDAVEEHLDGIMGLGVVPIMDDNTCRFGVIDIDAHGDLPDIDLAVLERRIRENDLPLVLCRSKSGGAHLYCFFAERVPAKLVRMTLSKWSGILGYAGVEVFPKQNTLPGEGKDRQLGNWINLPYFYIKDTIRYAYEGGKRIDLKHFLDLAESRRVLARDLVERAHGEHVEAPPCIQAWIEHGVPSGHRNEALYNMTIYLKKRNPDNYRADAHDLNARVLSPPLPHAEASKTIASAGRREYRYRCREEVCRKYCDSATCVKREYGITPEDKDELDVGGEPAEFERLEKILTDPVRWHLYLYGKPLTLTTAELMDHRLVRREVAEKLTRVVAPMKNTRWQGELARLMENCIEIEAPEDASAGGFTYKKLQEFVARCDLRADGGNLDDRQALLMGNPVVQQLDGKRVVMFRGQDFIDYLKKNRAEELRGANLWVVMRSLGVQHKGITVKGAALRVWYIELEDDQPTLEVPEGGPEL